jgi:ABC-type Fe3+-siderophore transport system permease subunit
VSAKTTLWIAFIGLVAPIMIDHLVSSRITSMSRTSGLDIGGASVLQA